MFLARSLAKSADTCTLNFIARPVPGFCSAPVPLAFDNFPGVFDVNQPCPWQYFSPGQMFLP